MIYNLIMLLLGKRLKKRGINIWVNCILKEEYLMIIKGQFSKFLQTNICCGYSLEVPHRGTSNEYPQHKFLWTHKICFNTSSLLKFPFKVFCNKAEHHENMPIYFDPLKPHFYIEKLGFTGVYIIFLISAQNIDCGYSLEPPRRGSSFLHLFCIRGPGAIGSL